MFSYSTWVLRNLRCSRSSLLPTPGYTTLCETTIREIGLRRDQQSPYVVTQFSSGETTPRFNDFCDVLRVIFWNWSQFGVPVSLLVSIAIPCYSSHESSIYILVFLSPSLRRLVLSLSQRPYDGWLAFHCLVFYQETDQCDKKNFRLIVTPKIDDSSSSRRSYCLDRINLQSPRDAGASKFHV